MSKKAVKSEGECEQEMFNNAAAAIEAVPAFAIKYRALPSELKSRIDLVENTIILETGNGGGSNLEVMSTLKEYTKLSMEKFISRINQLYIEITTERISIEGTEQVVRDYEARSCGYSSHENMAKEMLRELGP